MLPEQVETFEAIRSRFPKALRRIWSCDEIETNPKAERPGFLREHVFDFEDGVRMIASTDVGSKDPLIHLSFSVSKRGLKKYGPKHFQPRIQEILFVLMGTHAQFGREVLTETAVH